MVDRLVFALMRERRRLYRHVSGKLADTSTERGELRDNKRVKPPPQVGPITAEFTGMEHPDTDAPTAGASGGALILEVVDISGTGCALLAPDGLPFQMGMLIGFRLRAENVEVELRGRVMNIIPGQPGPG